MSTNGGGGGGLQALPNQIATVPNTNSNPNAPNPSGLGNAGQAGSSVLAPCTFALNLIRKRKVKFTVQLQIQELLSVPYVNGVLFCKVRLCNGGNHVSYSSKKEVNNSSVLWATDDSMVQFDVKAVQLYSQTSTLTSSSPGGLTPTPTSTTTGSPSVSSATQPNGFTGTANSSSSTSFNNQYYIIGYEPCLCRVSVRKELRGGKSYQKLGYVDYNLSDFILKNQQDLQSTAVATNSVDTTTSGSAGGMEYCVNRILKEYDSKKNPQRLDNSYLKIKIRIIDPLAQTLLNSALASSGNQSLPPQSKLFNEQLSVDTITAGNTSPLVAPLSAVSLSQPLCEISPRHAVVEKNSTTSMSSSASSSSISSSNNFTGAAAANQTEGRDTTGGLRFRPVAAVAPVTESADQLHLRNISSVSNSALSSSLNSNNSTMLSNNNVSLLTHSVHGHNRSCSNGSIKSNISFDYIIKTRNKKLMDDAAQQTSSSNSLINSCVVAVSGGVQQQQQQAAANSASIPIDPNSKLAAPVTSVATANTNATQSGAITVNTNVVGKIEPTNLRIAESRIDANEIISEIELELLANQLGTLNALPK